MKHLLTKISTSLLALYIVATNAAFAVTVDDLLPRADDPGNDPVDAELIEKFPELGITNNLPDLTKEELFRSAVNTVLGWTMALTIIAIVVAGIYYLIGRGKEEDISKAKNILLYLIIGLAFISAAFALTSGIAQIQFFE